MYAWGKRSATGRAAEAQIAMNRRPVHADFTPNVSVNAALPERATPDLVQLGAKFAALYWDVLAREMAA